jgi:hypothetical protein
MLRNINTCAGETQDKGSVPGGVDQDFPTKKRRRYFKRPQSDK